jgi:hypothetical protein
MASRAFRRGLDGGDHHQARVPVLPAMTWRLSARSCGRTSSTDGVWLAELTAME